MAITGVGQTAALHRLVVPDIETPPRPVREIGVRGPFGPAVTLSLSSDPSVAARAAGAHAAAGPLDPSSRETLRAFRDVAIAAKQDIADAARRLKAANPQDAAAAERARAALDREMAELSDVIIDGIRASDGADLFVASIGADALARPLAVNMVV